MSELQKKSDQNQVRDEKIVKMIRALARGIGPILFLVLITSVISQGGMDRLMTLTGRETITLVCILVMFFGMLWSYTHEIAGGVLIIAAYIALAINLGSILPGAVYPIFLVTGILHLYTGFKALGFRRRERYKEDVN